MISPLLLVKSFVLRSLSGDLARTVLTVWGIALGVAVMLAINLANDTALSRFRENINLVAGRANLEILPVSQADIDEHVLEQLKLLWDKDCLFTPVIDQFAVVPGEKADLVEILAIDVFADRAFRPLSATEDSPASPGSQVLASNAVYAGESFVRRYHLHKGSHFQLLVNDKRATITVAGVLSGTGAGKIFGGNILVMDIGPAQNLLDMPGRISRVDIICPAALLPAVRSELSVLLPGLSAESPEQRGAQVEKMISAFQYNLAALSLIALLVGAFLIYNTMSMTVVRKRPEIGIMRVLGVSRLRIFGIFFVQALILGAIGSGLGVALGALLARGAMQAVETTVQALYIDQPPAEVVYQASTLGAAFLSGLTLTIVAALAPIIEAMSVSPAEASRRASYEVRVGGKNRLLCGIGLGLLLLASVMSLMPAVGGFPLFGYAAAALIVFGVALCLPLTLSGIISWLKTPAELFWGSEGKLALLSLSGTLGRTSVAIASLMVGISMMVSLAIMIASFRQTVIVWVNQSLQADLYVAPLTRKASKRVGRLSNEVVREIRRLPGVADVDAFVEFPITYKGQLTNFGAGDLDVLARHGRLMFVSAEKPDAVFARLNSGHSCVVTESFALHNNIGVGAVLTVPSPAGPLNLTVQGIYYDYASDRGYIIIPRRLFRRYFADTYSTTLGVYLEKGQNIESMRSRLIAALGADTRLSIRSNSELRNEVLRVFDNTFAITYALHAIAILVAILGVMNAVLALTFDLRREFVILTYIGASLKQIRKIVLLQSAALGLLGNSAGLLVGALLSLLLINVINKQSFGWTVQLAIPFPFLAQSFVLIMIFSLLSGWLPAWAATRNISAEALRIE